MGIFNPCSGGRCVKAERDDIPGAPDPQRFEIIRTEEFVGVDEDDQMFTTLAEIRYPDATKCEGRKILVFRARRYQITTALTLDPHFSDEPGPTVPIARFEPTDRGWAMARAMINEAF